MVFQLLSECRVSLAFNILGGGFLTDTEVFAIMKQLSQGLKRKREITIQLPPQDNDRVERLLNP